MKYLASLLLILISTSLAARDYSYDKISARNKNVALTKLQVDKAKMEGECMVGLKEINFKKKNEFDPVAEWSSFRTAPLLSHMSPCEVLIIMEVANKKLRESSEPK